MTHPTRLLLIVAGAEPRELELRLRSAVALLAELEEPIDLVLCDPPWGLRRAVGGISPMGTATGAITGVVGGYVDVDAPQYLEFTHSWMKQAAVALKTAGQLAVI